MKYGKNDIRWSILRVICLTIGDPIQNGIRSTMRVYVFIRTTIPILRDREKEEWSNELIQFSMITDYSIPYIYLVRHSSVDGLTGLIQLLLYDLFDTTQRILWPIMRIQDPPKVISSSPLNNFVFFLLESMPTSVQRTQTMSNHQHHPRTPQGRQQQQRRRRQQHHQRRNRHRRPSKSKNSEYDVVVIQTWLKAIQDSTACLINTNYNDQALVDASISYLEELERILLLFPPESPPTQLPPPFSPFSFSSLTPSQAMPSPRAVPVAAAASMTQKSTLLSRNPYASIALNDDDDDDYESESDYENENENGNNTDLLEAGDLPLLFSNNNNTNRTGMNGLRLLMRVCTSSADLWAHKGTRLSQQHRQWNEGVVALQRAIVCIRQALELADSQISRWLAEEETATGQEQKQQQEQLQNDADIVHVATLSLLRQRETCLVVAQREIHRLRKILQPQWKARDQVKQKLGNERWVNNPNPKHDYSKLREDAEQELNQLQTLIRELEEGMESLELDAQGLKARVEKVSPSSPSSSKSPRRHHRYNQQRRPSSDDPRRVPGYPNATDFGWTYTGCTENAEFFEKEFEQPSTQSQQGEDDDDDGLVVVLVKLDFYFTTGTVKTSMDHPTQGRKTQLFGKRVSPQLYTKILLNPRVHTNVRYQTKKPNRNHNHKNHNRNHKN